VSEIPKLEILHQETPSPLTPLGAKGMAEGNCMSTPACIANAVADALGVKDISLPLTPLRLHALMAGEEQPPLKNGAASRVDAPSSPPGLDPATAHAHPPLKGEGRTAEGSPGWGGGGAAYAEAASPAEAPSPPPGPLARADLPPAEPRCCEGSATQQSDRSRQQPTSVGGGGRGPP